MDIGDADGYGADVGIMWAAYQAGSFEEYEKDLSQEQFVEVLMEQLSQFDSIFMADELNSNFRSGRGPVAVFGLTTDGEIVKVHTKFFGWATPRNILRVFVSFFQMMRYSRHVGLMVWKTEDKYTNLYQRLRRYGLPTVRIGGFFAMQGKR